MSYGAALVILAASGFPSGEDADLARDPDLLILVPEMRRPRRVATERQSPDIAALVQVLRKQIKDEMMPVCGDATKTYRPAAIPTVVSSEARK
jgi:hypothetical protein